MRIKIDINTFHGIGTSEDGQVYQFTTKEAADDVSEQLKDYWDSGIGSVTGPFISGPEWELKIWDVSIPKELE